MAHDGLATPSDRPPLPTVESAGYGLQDFLLISVKEAILFSFYEWKCVFLCRETFFEVGSINSLCHILVLFSRTNCKLKRERSGLRDR